MYILITYSCNFRIQRNCLCIRSDRWW